jgi:hypothetical protein
MILNSANSKGKILTFFLAALFCFGFQELAAQGVPTPKPKITPAPTPKITSPVIVFPKPVPPKDTKKVVRNEADTPAEKSIATESKVIVNLCVLEGSVRINGWDRNEIRAYVADGSQVGFKIMQDNPKTKKPVWVTVLGFDPQKNKEIKPEECLSGSEIDLDVPRGAIIKLKSGESEIKIESVARAAVESLSGDIYLNDIAGGVEATTYQGDLMVERSGGQMILNNTAGNIIALDVAPSDVGDIFKAKTNSGRITLKSVEHRLIETGSISGSTSFDGELLSGGQYSFGTQNGSIVLAVSPDTVCKINAWFGFGAFASEIPLQNTLKKEQSLSAQIGTGEATCSLNLKTGSGVIRIRKPASENPEKPGKDKEKIKEDKEKNKTDSENKTNSVVTKNSTDVKVTTMLTETTKVKSTKDKKGNR